MEKDKRIGRPPVATKNQRTAWIKVMLTTAEKRSILRAARLAGEPASAWSRRVMVTSARGDVA